MWETTPPRRQRALCVVSEKMQHKSFDLPVGGSTWGWNYIPEFDNVGKILIIAGFFDCRDQIVDKYAGSGLPRR
jgi:hypothetical protein